MRLRLLALILGFLPGLLFAQTYPWTPTPLEGLFNYSGLPTNNLTLGTPAQTVDQGTVYWNGTTWQSTPVYAPNGNITNGSVTGNLNVPSGGSITTSGTGTIYAWGGGVSPNSTVLTATPGSAGNLTGTYYYFVTYTTATGETDPSETLASVTVSAQLVNLTNIPVSPSPLVTGRNIYRTSANSYTQYQGQLVTSIPDNVTTVYTDNLVDGSLGAYMPGINTTIPQIYRSDYNGMVYGWGITSIALGPQALATYLGYSNTAIGPNVLRVNTGGVRNTAVGIDAMLVNTTGSQNVAIGPHALGSQTTDNNNVAIGYVALSTQSGSTGLPSVAVGNGALQSGNVSGGMAAVGVGYNALSNFTTGQYNTAVGYQSLVGGASASGSYNTGMGYQTLNACTSCANNTAVGYSAGNAEVTGSNFTAVGYEAGLSATTNLTAVGSSAAQYVSSGSANTAFGYNALTGVSGTPTTGGSNTAVGYAALTAVQGAGALNTAMGREAAKLITTGSQNTIVGYEVASTTLTTGSNNILIGTSSAVTTIASNTSNEVNIGGALMGYNVVTGISCTSGNGCGTGNAAVGGNGTFYFTLTLGSGSPSSTITLTMPAAATDWSCNAKDRTTNLIGYQTNTTASTTAPALTFYTPLGVATAPTAGDLVDVHCWMR